MARHNETGKWGEDLAADYLTEQGYAIAERNWRQGRLEIDIIAMRDDTLVVAEVKTRTNKDEDPLDAVDNKKSLAWCGRPRLTSKSKTCHIRCASTSLPSPALPTTILSSIYPTHSIHRLKHIIDIL